ncbi:MAG: glycosyltransferase [Acidobacteria bacterium]|nr:glycosyltransferase [Acidobacteriota bacterium]
MMNSDAGWVSVVIPARDEEANIERVVRSVAAQAHVAEILVVDDQSSDRTPEILARLKPEFPVLRVLRTGPLPEGWTGKAHAVATGAREARAEWLLLTDADTEHLEGSLESLLRRATSRAIDLLSVSPGQETPTWWEKAVIPLIFVELARRFRFDDVSNPDSPVAAANGQYVLIRREVYERAGGHEAVRGEILEDVALARRVKRAGGKLLFLPGALWVRTRMYRTFGEMWRGWTKNLFVLYERNLGRVMGKAAELLVADIFPAAAFLALAIVFAAGLGGQVTGLGLAGCFLLLLIRQARYGRALEDIGFDARLAPYQLVGAGLLALLLLNSARAHVWSGIVYWRGRGCSTRG